MEFDKKNIFAIGLVLSLGLNIILSFLVFQDKFLFKATSIQKSVVSSQEEKKSESAPAEEIKLESEVRIEKEYEVLIPEIRKNDPSNDGWMVRKWDNVYSNPERVFFSDKYDGSDLTEPTYEEVNTVTPNSFVIFENEELSLRIPFNERWGEPLYKFKPYTVEENVSWDRGATDISFGRITYPIPEGGKSYYLIHPSNLTIRNRTTSTMNEFISSLVKLSRGSTWGFKVKNITSLSDPNTSYTILEFFDGGLTTYSHLVFFGDKYEYDFSISDFYSDPKLAFDEFEDIASTIELK